MHVETLKTLLRLKDMSQSDLARAAGVTRQRVSQWFKTSSPDGYVNIQTEHLRAMAKALGVTADDLLNPLPLLDGSATAQRELTNLAWDKLYPSLGILAADALRSEPQALARLVQTYGLYATASLLGSVVWRRFSEYKRYIHPARREGLERVWLLRQNQMKN